jgi:hypothetical protein
MKKSYLIIFILFFSMFGGPRFSPGDQQGVLEIRIRDHREAIGDFSNLIVTFDAILVSPRAGLKFWQTQWTSLSPSVPSLDLTQYVEKRSASVFRSPIPAGSFDGLHLKIKSVAATLKKNSRSANIKNRIGPIKLGFETRARGDTVIVLDLVVLDMSDHPPRGYELDIQGYELYSNGKLIEKVPPG